jgi:hypothetical protein
MNPASNSSVGESHQSSIHDCPRCNTMNLHPVPLRTQLGAPLALGTTAVGLTALLSGAAAQAQPTSAITGGESAYAINFDSNIGDDPLLLPEGPAPWLQAVVSPLRGGGGVEIVLKANLRKGEFIGSVGFSVDPSVEISSLSLQCDGSKGCSSATLDKGKKGGGFDIPNAKGLSFGFDFPTSNNPRSDRFEYQDSVVLRLFGKGLTPASFAPAIQSSAALGSVLAAAKVQGIMVPKKGSTTIAASQLQQVQVPGPLPLLGAGVALGFSRRLRRRLFGAQGPG